MKKYILGLAAATMIFASCTNDDKVFSDYTKQAVYFPIQYPVRTIVLGEDRLDNTIDLEHAFSIGASVGGMYENKKDWTINFGLAPEYMTKIEGKNFNNIQGPIKMLPADYYSIVTNADSTMIIPKGSFNSSLRVNLTDAFFNDPKSVGLYYVLPLKIKSASTDILTGETAFSLLQKPDPNVHNGGDWKTDKRPKNYTLFAVRFINQLHGTFFHRGKQYKNGVLDKTFHAKDTEMDMTTAYTTTGLREVTMKRMGEFVAAANASKLTFTDAVDGVGDITVAPVASSLLGVTGTGKYYKSSTEFAKTHGLWLVDPKTGKQIPHLTVVLDYTVTGISAGNTYNFKDTLVFRDNGVKYEEFSPVILP